MNLNEILQQVVNKNSINCTTFESFLKGMNKVYSIHTKLVDDISTCLKEANIDPDKVFVACPNCGCQTMLSYKDCHVCGTSLYETDETTQEKNTTKKPEETKPKKVVEPEIVEEEIEVKESTPKKEEPETSSGMVDNGWTVRNLHVKAREIGVKNATLMKKTELIEAINAHLSGAAQEDVVETKEVETKVEPSDAAKDAPKPKEIKDEEVNKEKEESFTIADDLLEDDEVDLFSDDDGLFDDIELD